MRQSRAILVEYVQEMRADLFNLTSISKKNKLYKQFLQYRFTMRENNIGKYERSIFKWQVYL